MDEKIKTKKTLGQNFLRDRTILRKMVVIGEITGKDLVLEIGPGEGILTEEILKAAGKVIAVEKDDRLIDFLKNKFSDEISDSRFELIHGDVLETPIFNFQFSTEPYKIVANLPYYITGKFLRKFLQAENQPKLMVLMLQKEVARRIAGYGHPDDRQSVLSLSIKCFGEPKYIQTVKAGAFRPAPKVDSAILLISKISRDFFRHNKINEQEFFEILKAGFAQKRKVLNKKLLRFATPEKIEEVFKTCGLNEKVRAENLSLENWGCLVKNICH